MSGPTAIRRIVLRLRPGAADPAMLRLVAELARLLDIGIHGLFVEDEALLSLAALPFAREIRLPTFDWHPLDIEELARELRQSAARLRQLLDQAASSAGVSNSFETLRGSPELAGRLGAGDIVIAIEPRAAPLPRLDLRAGPDSASLMLLIPARARPQSGPFAAVIAPDSAAVLEIASRLALAANDGLILLSVQDKEGRRMAGHAADTGIPQSRIIRGQIPSAAAPEIIKGLARLHPRLVVMPLPDLAGDAWQVAINLGVPVLLVQEGGA